LEKFFHLERILITKSIKSLLGRLNPFCTKMMEQAVGACVARTHYEVGIPHLLAQLVEEPSCDFACIVESGRLDLSRLRLAIQEELRSYKTGNSARPVFAPSLLLLLESAWLESSLNLGQTAVRSASLALAFRENPSWAGLSLQDVAMNLRTVPILEEFAKITAKSSENESHSAAVAPSGSAAPVGVAEGSALQRFTVNFTEQARQGKIDPIFGRDDEIRQAIDILSRRRKNNPIFIGEAGVGKTAVVEGLALKIIEGAVPDRLKGVEIMGIDLGLLSAGAGVRGEFENRLKSILREVKESPQPIILFIDEAHTLIGAGGEAGKNDAANLLKPELARGELKCLAATTFSEYRRYFEKDPAMARRFQAVTVAEPTPQAAVVMIRGLRERYEKFHGVVVTHGAVQAACELSHRYIAGRQLPDKAVDLLDTACARVRLEFEAPPARLQSLRQKKLDLDHEIASLEREEAQGRTADSDLLSSLRTRNLELQSEGDLLEVRWNTERGLVEELHKATDSAEQARLRAALLDVQGESPMVHAQVDESVVAMIIEEWTGIPAGNMLKDDAKVLLELESTLNERVIGQSWGVRELAHTIKAAKLQLTKPESPLAVFLLAGPSGVGKTETAKAIADMLFGGERSVVTLNMSEYQDGISVTQLKGASAGYVGYGEGGVLTEGVRKNPYTVVILDEIEKAHKDVLNMFYQVFDQGWLRDGEGRSIDFRNTVIVMTSNLGTDSITRMAMEAETSYLYADYTEAIVPELTAHFQPALLARCKVVPYLPLGADSMLAIAGIKLDKLARRVEAVHGVRLACTERLLRTLVDRCVLVQSGARLIDTVLDRDILPLVSMRLLDSIASGEKATDLVIDADEQGQICCAELRDELAAQ
jgi:type VI secretion system protein VasG